MSKRMRPKDIRYSQNSISSEFSGGRTLQHTLDKLKDGRLQVTDLPTITVCERNGKWYTADNRRLWLFKNLESLGKLYDVAVKVGSFDVKIGLSKFTTKNDGTSINIRMKQEDSDFDDDFLFDDDFGFGDLCLDDDFGFDEYDIDDDYLGFF